MSAICPVCGKDFTPPDRPYGGRPKRYCSNRCRKVYNCQQYKRKQHEAKVAAIKARPCAFCGKDFKPSLYRPAQKFCSHRCWLAARLAEYAAKREKRKAERLAKRQRVCPVCGKEFVADPCHLGAKYCSVSCSNRARAGSKPAAKPTTAPTVSQAYADSLARVRAYLKLPARARWANRGMLTDTELRMAEQMWQNHHDGWEVRFNVIRH